MGNGVESDKYVLSILEACDGLQEMLAANGMVDAPTDISYFVLENGRVSAVTKP